MPGLPHMAKRAAHVYVVGVLWEKAFSDSQGNLPETKRWNPDEIPTFDCG